MAEICSLDQLKSGRCVPCEGGVPRFSLGEARTQLKALSGWELLHDPDRISRKWVVRNFVAGVEFFQRVTDIAESEGHHPDLHLVGYRNVTIEIWTHAIQGLSLNDFILAARIDQLDIDLQA